MGCISLKLIEISLVDLFKCTGVVLPDCVVTSLFSQKFKGTLEHTFTRNFSKK